MLLATKIWLGTLSAALLAPLADPEPAPRVLPRPTVDVKDKAPWGPSEKARQMERSFGISRSEPVAKEIAKEQAEQIELRLTAFEASSDTLQSLGLLADGKLVREPDLLKSHDAWDAAVDTASRLRAIQVLSRPQLVTLNKQTALIEILGADTEATDPATGKTVALNIARTWNTTPTLLDGKRLRLDVKYRTGYSEISPELSATEIAKGAGRGHGVETSVEIPLDKPTIVGRFTSFEKPKAGDKKQGKRGDTAVETNTVLVVTAHRITEKDLDKVRK